MVFELKLIAPWRVAHFWAAKVRHPGFAVLRFGLRDVGLGGCAE